MSQSWEVKNRFQATTFCEHVMQEAEKGSEWTYTLEKRGKRSLPQNSALHATMRRLAEAMNDAGYDYSHPFNEDFKIPWTEVSVKEILLRPIIAAMYGKESTTELTTEELSSAVEIMLGRISELTGVYVEGLGCE